MDREKKSTEVIDSYLYALVKKKGYTKEDIIDALQYIATGKVEYKGTGHPLEKIGTENIQKELFKSCIKKNVYNRNKGEKPTLHSLDSIVMESIEKEGAFEAYKQMTNKESYLNRLAEQYILDHFEFEDGALYYSQLHEDMNSFIVLKDCEPLFEQMEPVENLEDDFFKEESSKVKEEPIVEQENLLEDLVEEESPTFGSEMEKLDYCLTYMQKKENYSDTTLIDVLNRASEGNFKVFTRENNIRSLAQTVPKEVINNKKALLLMKQMEESEDTGNIMDLLNM